MIQWIGLRENSQESPIFNGKMMENVPLNPSIEFKIGPF
jgi:hypothetical protein